MGRLAFVLIMALINVPLAAQPARSADPLQSRVTIDFRDVPAAHVIGSLAAAAGLKVEMGSGALRSVTITLTNVKLETALNAVCENASCMWRLQGTLNVTPVPDDRVASLPSLVSFQVHDRPLRDVFHALAAAVGVPLIVDPGLPSEPIRVQYKNAQTANVLNMLCNMNNCQWNFDAVRGLHVSPKR
jgi:hypothetical protein